VIHDFLTKFKPQRLNYIRDSLSSFVFQNSNLLVVTRFQGQKCKFRYTFDTFFCLHNLRLCVCVFNFYSARVPGRKQPFFIHIWNILHIRYKFESTYSRRMKVTVPLATSELLHQNIRSNIPEQKLQL
jgi:hypothetical protein